MVGDDKKGKFERWKREEEKGTNPRRIRFSKSSDFARNLHGVSQGRNELSLYPFEAVDLPQL